MKKTANIIKLTDKHVARTYGRLPLALVRGKGCYVWDAEGKKYLDCVTGLAVDNLGHCHPEVVKAIRKQAGTLIHVSNLYHIEPQSRLAKDLTRLSFAGKVFFCNSGTEANEAAIKLARKHSTDQGYNNRFEILTFTNSFHGRTLGSLSATAQTKFHSGFKPLLSGFKYVRFNDIDAVAKAVSQKTCAVLIEPVQGEGGVNIPDKQFLKDLRQLCRDNGLLLIFDEVQTGFGRTGALFAYERFGVKPDVITLAKALGGGMAIGAMMATDEVMKSFVPGTHAATFGGNPLACAAAQAALDVVAQKPFLKNVRETGDYFAKQLKSLAKQHPVVKEVRGLGMMLAMELKVPGMPVLNDCMEKGILINCVQNTTLRFLPPLIIKRKEIDTLIQTVSESLSRLES
ncbi:Acetylornithine aminotransferase [Nitrospina gracilis 3/211]|uniref:Acetylornithine aminotransferase n=1 Tax=Nitrospina gracilis (strain 3/211) TaxID=1266370 RepID=M1Z3U6_NITG3|nr:MULTISPECIES: acetylornithine transaminase [Nitrospina]MCF8722032.1 putative acetylornithine/succinylornithine family transaminase [Nitrospina sp. Nb-3]CCQ92159.1 Acetylornithine aminotransferase [Nitrospina gracilis 3/211]